MRKTITSALLALAVLGVANTAWADKGEDFGTRTTSQQQSSPN